MLLLAEGEDLLKALNGVKDRNDIEATRGGEDADPGVGDIKEIDIESDDYNNAS